MGESVSVFVGVVGSRGRAGLSGYLLVICNAGVVEVDLLLKKLAGRARGW